MKVEDLLKNSNESLTESYNESVGLLIETALEEDIVQSIDEAEQLLNENAAKIVKKYVGEYQGSRPPEVMTFQDPDDKNHVVALASGDNMFFRYDLINGKVVSEEKYSSFKEIMVERDSLLAERYTKIRSEQYFKRNWKKTLMWIFAGTAGIFIGGPLIVAVIAHTAPAAATFMAGLVKPLVAGLGIGAGLAAFGWLGKTLEKRSA